MPEMHLREPGFTYSALVHSLKKRKNTKFKETGDSRYIYQNELDKACSQYDMAYRDLKDLNRTTAADKVLCDKAFNIAKNPKYEYQRGLASMIYNFFDKKIGGATILARLETLAMWATRNKSAIKKENISNKELSEEPHKPIIRKFNKRKVHSPFIDNIWGTDLADMQLISKFNKEFRFLLCYWYL